MRRHLGLFALVLLACVSCDHATKHVAEQWLVEYERIALLGGVVQLQLVANHGAFLSLGAGAPEWLRELVLIGLVPLLLAGAALLIWRTPAASRAQALAFGLLVGGGLGNWLDRVRGDGAVTDFVSLGLGPLRTGIFNLADVAIVAALVLLFAVRERGEPGDAESGDVR